MQRTKVVSSNVASVGYDAGDRILEVEFASGEVYQYMNVPTETARQLLDAPSVGKYLNQYVKKFYTVIKL